MSHLFSECKNLKFIKLSNFNTSEVTTMDHMFYSSGLTSIDLSNFNTKNVKSMENMFSFSDLYEIDISNFNILLNIKK